MLTPGEVDGSAQRARHQRQLQLRGLVWRHRAVALASTPARPRHVCEIWQAYAGGPTASLLFVPGVQSPGCEPQQTTEAATALRYAACISRLFVQLSVVALIHKLRFSLILPYDLFTGKKGAHVLVCVYDTCIGTRKNVRAYDSWIRG